MKSFTDQLRPFAAIVQEVVAPSSVVGLSDPPPSSPLNAMKWALGPWESLLNWKKGARSSSSKYEQEAVQRVGEVMDAWRSGGVGIPVRTLREYEGQERGANPDVRDMHGDRDAFLQLGASAVLTSIDQRKLAESEAECVALLAAIARRARSEQDHGSRGTVRPSRTRPRNKGNSDSSDAYADSDRARFFFEAVLPRTLENLDKRIGAWPGKIFQDLIPAAYNSTDTRSIDRWSVAWTAGVVAIATDWLLAAGDYNAKGAIEALWAGAGGRLHQFSSKSVGLFLTRLPRSLSLANRKDKLLMYPDLHVGPVLCHLLEESSEHWARTARNEATHTSVSINALDQESMGGEIYYRGRSVAHLYLAVWIAEMSSLLVEGIQQ